MLGNRVVAGLVGAAPTIQRVLERGAATVDTRVMVLDMKGNPITKGTIVAAPGQETNADGRDPDTVIVLSNKKNRSRNLNNLRLLTEVEAANDTEDGLPVVDMNRSPEVLELLGLWKLRSDHKVGGNLGNPTSETVRLAREAGARFDGPPETKDRTVYVVEGAFSDAEGLMRRLFGEVSITGSAVTADRRAQVDRLGATWVLREDSSATDRIAGTIELQIGEHSCEYKFARSKEEQAEEKRRVEQWSPDSPKTLENAEHIRREFAQAQDPRGADVTADLVGGSYGKPEAPYFRSWDEFAGQGPGKSFFTDQAWKHLLGYPEKSRLLFVNRNFGGSRIDTQRYDEKTQKLVSRPAHDLPHGFGVVDPVLAHQGRKHQAKEAARTRDISSRHGPRTPYPGPNALSPDVSVVSVGRLFWRRFKSLDAEGQIGVITESLGTDGGQGAVGGRVTHGVRAWRRREERQGRTGQQIPPGGGDVHDLGRALLQVP
ncbi:hypothetical protein ACFFQW_46435 [Umezawaea endophytica]|uniref:Uncharacterized protein n=1 Tax=Umezawaea endophytica TaxID=1654476 RepID=A0A9X2VWP9_9PSEU|nr:hypothetical protein [Umezawaea endophytica]MCS7483777.1 hypothetical protein [Umezawaea endophytica]